MGGSSVDRPTGARSYRRGAPRVALSACAWIAALALAGTAAAQPLFSRYSPLARIGEFFDLADIGRSPEAAATQAPATQAGGGGNTLDVLHGDVVAYTTALCKQVETAPRDQVEALQAEYEQFRLEELAELDRIAAEEEALEELRRRIDGTAPEGAAKRALSDARKEVGRLETEHKELVAANELLIRRQERFSTATAGARAASAEIALLEREIAARRAGAHAPDSDLLGGLGSAAGQRSIVATLESELAAERARLSSALASVAEVLPAHPVPTSLEGFTDPKSGGLKGTLYRDWRAYRDRLAPLDSRIAEAKAKEQAAFDALARIQSGAPGSAAALDKEALVAEYRQRGQQVVVARTVALLTYQLHGNVTACLEARAAALDEPEESETQEVAWSREYWIEGHITDTCYGSTLGESKPVAGNYVFHPHYWNSFRMKIGPGRQVELEARGPPFTLHNTSAGTLERLSRTELAADGSFSMAFVNPTPPTKNGIYRRGAGGIVPETHYPYRLEGRLVHDPAVPQQWRGSGTGRVLYRVVESGPDWEVVHHGEPCTIVWDLSEIPPR